MRPAELWHFDYLSENPTRLLWVSEGFTAYYDDLVCHRAGVLTTEAAVADVPAPMVLSTLLGYLAVYGVLTVAYVLVLFYLARKAAQGERVDSYETPRSGAAQVEMVPGE